MRHILAFIYDEISFFHLYDLRLTHTHYIDRFMWFSFLSVGLVINSIIIISLWEKFQTSPTITGLDTDFHNWDVQFPAISICPMRPTSDEKVWEYASRWITRYITYLFQLSFYNVIFIIRFFFSPRSIYDNNTDNERYEIFSKFVNEIASFSYNNIKTFENFTNYDWLPKDTPFKDLAYKVRRLAPVCYYHLLDNTDTTTKKKKHIYEFIPTRERLKMASLFLPI